MAAGYASKCALYGILNKLDVYLIRGVWPCMLRLCRTVRRTMGSIGWKGPKSLFKHGEERSIVYDYTHEEKINFEGFYSKRLLWQPGIQPHSLEALIKSSHSIDDSNSCSLIKQDLTLKFLFRSVQSTKVLTVNSCFQCFLQASSEYSLILHQTQCTNFLVSRHYWSLITPSFRNFSLILSKVETLAWSQLAQK